MLLYTHIAIGRGGIALLSRIELAIVDSGFNYTIHQERTNSVDNATNYIVFNAR